MSAAHSGDLRIVFCSFLTMFQTQRASTYVVIGLLAFQLIVLLTVALVTLPSIAQWHAHINMCIPPAEKKKEMWGPNPRFGLAGTIVAKEECQSAGANSGPRSSAGWVTSTPWSKKQKTSGRSSAKLQRTRTEEAFSSQHSAFSQTQVLQSEIGDQNLGIEFVLRKS